VTPTLRTKTSEKEKAMSDKRVKDVMTHLVVTAHPEDSVHDIAGALARNAISGAPVVKDGRVVGVITEADLLVAVSPPVPVSRRLTVLDFISMIGRAKPMKDPRAASVGDAMTHSVITIRPTDSIWKAAAMMDRFGVKRLPVTDEDDALLGILSRADLVRAMGRDDAEIAAEVRSAVEVLGPDVFEDLETTCVDGVVTLAGMADRRSTRDIAVRIAMRVAGVTAIKDRLDYITDDDKISLPPRHDNPWAAARR
jgi:CBS domain-containing protein